MAKPRLGKVEVLFYVFQCEQLRGEIIKHGKGTIEISHLVDRNDRDFSRLMQVAEHFAIDGAEVVMTPKMTRPAKFDYDCVYGSLKDTRYYGECPDLKMGDWIRENDGILTLLYNRVGREPKIPEIDSEHNSLESILAELQKIKP